MEPLFLVPFLLLLVMEALVLGLNRKHARRWPILSAATYLAVVSLAITFAWSGRKTDEFGYAWIPAILLTDPLYFLAPQAMMQHLLIVMVLGAALISAVLYAVAALLGYARNSRMIGVRPDPAEESTQKP